MNDIMKLLFACLFISALSGFLAIFFAKPSMDGR